MCLKAGAVVLPNLVVLGPMVTIRVLWHGRVRCSGVAFLLGAGDTVGTGAVPAAEGRAPRLHGATARDGLSHSKVHC